MHPTEPETADELTVGRTSHDAGGRFLRFHFWTWAHRATATAFLLCVMLGYRAGVGWFQGSSAAAIWFQWLPFVDPLAGLEVLLATGRATTTMLLGMTTTIGIALVLGRVFCGWICPLGLVLEVNDGLRQWVRRRLKRVGIHLPEVSLPHAAKYWSLLLCLGLSVVSTLPVFTMVSPVNLFVLGAAAIPSIGFGLAALLMLFELFVPRGFCRSLCPLGAFYSLLGRYAVLRVRVVGRERLLCRQCTLRCPMRIRVMEDHVVVGKRSVDDPECTRCGICTDACLGRILRLGIRNPKIRERSGSCE